VASAGVQTSERRPWGFLRRLRAECSCVHQRRPNWRGHWCRTVQLPTKKGFEPSNKEALNSSSSVLSKSPFAKVSAKGSTTCSADSAGTGRVLLLKVTELFRIRMVTLPGKGPESSSTPAKWLQTKILPTIKGFSCRFTISCLVRAFNPFNAVEVMD
jgi:hypothetical protein